LHGEGAGEKSERFRAISDGSEKIAVIDQLLRELPEIAKQRPVE
jgi:hypothetical protein